MQYRRDHAFLNSNGYGDIDLGIVTNALRRPARIHSRMFRQYARDERNKQVCECRFDALCSFHLHRYPRLRLEHGERRAAPSEARGRRPLRSAPRGEGLAQRGGDLLVDGSLKNAEVPK